MSRSLYIEEHENDDDPCDCGNCDWKGTFADLLPVDDGALTAGDPSFAGRCPECDSVAYLDRPQDRAGDALRHLIWTLGKGYPPGDANLERATAKFTEALAACRPGLTITMTIA